MQCAYKCAVVKLLKKSIIISILRAEDTDCVCFSKKKKTGIYVLVDKASWHRRTWSGFRRLRIMWEVKKWVASVTRVSSVCFTTTATTAAAGTTACYNYISVALSSLSREDDSCLASQEILFFLWDPTSVLTVFTRGRTLRWRMKFSALLCGLCRERKGSPFNIVLPYNKFIAICTSRRRAETEEE